MFMYSKIYVTYNFPFQPYRFVSLVFFVLGINLGLECAELLF
jgi:hypothetical protein